ncbi:MAG: hypothetical protein H6672_05055 [Anaerolineaceae bacterium]|nr:hypothetical protein [Anaerolineaceae bacterium]
MFSKTLRILILGSILALIGVISILAQEETPGATPLTTGTPAAVSLTPAPSEAFETQAVSVFPIGPGFSDVIPHQIVRTDSDYVYVFSARAEYSNKLIAYWTTTQGLPTAGDFASGTETTVNGNPISVETIYDGAFFIHVLVNTNSGTLVHYPFDTRVNTFGAAQVLKTGNPAVSGDYIGTAGVSAGLGINGTFHVTYWGSGNHIVYQAYTANNDGVWATSGSASQVDTSGHATHPALAVSPADHLVTVAWVSEATSTARILARTRAANGTWGAVEIVSAAPVWTSRNLGVNIDQGPSLIITDDGVKHLLYIEDYDNTTEYGHVHYVRYSNGAWLDQPIALYSHDPAIIVNSAGEMFIVAHGAEAVGDNVNLYMMRRSPGCALWEPPEHIISPPPGSSFDSSVSTKWAGTGYNRPETIEMVFFLANGGSYLNTTLYYGRIPYVAGAAPTCSPSNAAPTRNYFTVNSPTLTWNRVTGAVEYEIQVGTSARFAAPLAFTTTVPASILAMTTPALENGTYYWRVRALDGTRTGAWSSADSFTVNAP